MSVDHVLSNNTVLEDSIKSPNLNLHLSASSSSSLLEIPMDQENNTGVHHHPTSEDRLLQTISTHIPLFLTRLEHAMYIDPLDEKNKSLLVELFDSLESMIEVTHVDMTQTIVNLSSRILNPHEISLLQKGLNFCPTPGDPLMGNLVRDLDYFHDNFRWEYHFKDNPLPIQPFDKLIMMTKVFKKTHRPPPPQSHKNLEAFIFLNERDLHKQKLMEPQSKNLTREEKGALHTLKSDPHITLKQADKGGAVVFLDTTDYIAEANRQLADRSHYSPVDHDLTQEFSGRIETYLTTLADKHTISKGTFERIRTNNPRTSAFYHNPKIHKQHTDVGIPPGRPIISERISRRGYEHSLISASIL